MRSRYVVAILSLIVLVAAGAEAYMHLVANQTANQVATNHIKKTSPVAPSTTFDKSANSLTDPTSIWVIVNKQLPLNPKDYVPADLTVPNVPLRVPGNESMQLRQPAATALEQLFAAARQQGVQLMLSSGYRSYTYQVNLYGSYVRADGQAQADTFSARPGYSEHQTGLAADIEPLNQKCDVDTCFGDLPEGKWLAANAYLYGFVVRYTAANQSFTGYEPEPWHIRYVGTALSDEMHATDSPSLEQFFGLAPATHY